MYPNLHCSSRNGHILRILFTAVFLCAILLASYRYKELRCHTQVTRTGEVINQLKQQLDSASTLLKEMYDQKEDLKNKLSAEQEQCTTVKREIYEERRHVDRLQMEVVRLQNDKKSLNMALEKAENGKNIIAAESDGCAQDLASLQKNLNELEKSCSLLHRDCQDKNSALKRILENERYQHQLETRQYGEQFSKLAGEMANLRQKNMQLELKDGQLKVKNIQSDVKYGQLVNSAEQPKSPPAPHKIKTYGIGNMVSEPDDTVNLNIIASSDATTVAGGLLVTSVSAPVKKKKKKRKFNGQDLTANSSTSYLQNMDSRMANKDLTVNNSTSYLQNINREMVNKDVNLRNVYYKPQESFNPNLDNMGLIREKGFNKAGNVPVKSVDGEQNRNWG